MPQQFKNFLKTTLSATLANGATSCTVASNAGWPTSSAANFFYATLDDGTNQEVVKVTANASTTWTIARGADGTTQYAGTWAIGTKVELRPVAGDMANAQGLREQTVTSSATVTPDADNNDIVTITAQAAALTLANPTGSPSQGQKLIVRIKDNGTARAITFGTAYRAVGTALPTTTIVSKTLYLGGIYNATDTKWDVVAVAQE